ncbi:glycine zipper domain-containing protein [Shinella pollutisoli]|uniref:DUF883 domain-containing protein n=1 Tax=Shinella pollutisoli TaxID=2250594 RepID=A0ABV7DL75_9HYPH|nr:hypothetical protein [Shinella pollutisoli]
MANGLFSSRSKTLRSGLREEAQAVEEQIAELRAEIAALAGSLAGDARKARRKAGAAAQDLAGDLKERAESDLHDMIAAGEDILASLQDRYRQSGKEIRRSVHEHPLAALGLAAAAGFVIAALMRR